MTKDEALKLALEAFCEIAESRNSEWQSGRALKALADIDKVLAQCTWVTLTEDEIVLISADCAATHQHMDIQFARAIEAALKAKNT
jgi:sugar/nucleoside kinase (ribokinase family)